MYFVFMYENRRMKPVEIILRRERETRENSVGLNLAKRYCKHICKYHSAFPVQLLHANNKFFKSR
jgi:hypothetical protein